MPKYIMLTHKGTKYMKPLAIRDVLTTVELDRTPGNLAVYHALMNPGHSINRLCTLVEFYGAVEELGVEDQFTDIELNCIIHKQTRALIIFRKPSKLRP